MQAAIRRLLRNLVIHASYEALYRAIVTTKEVRASFPVDQQSEERHTSGRGHWLRIRKFVLCSCSVFTSYENSFVCLFGAMDGFGAKRSVVDEG